MMQFFGSTRVPSAPPAPPEPTALQLRNRVLNNPGYANALDLWVSQLYRCYSNGPSEEISRLNTQFSSNFLPAALKTIYRGNTQDPRDQLLNSLKATDLDSLIHELGVEWAKLGNNTEEKKRRAEAAVTYKHPLLIKFINEGIPEFTPAPPPAPSNARLGCSIS